MMNFETLVEKVKKNKQNFDLSKEESAALEVELALIEDQNLTPYFFEILKLGRKLQNTCNSQVAYILGIADKPTGKIRQKKAAGDVLPDIDMDFSAEKRELIKEYVVQKYGKDNVCSIGTIQKLFLKSTLKDVARVKGFDFETVNNITRKLPSDMTLDEAIANNEEFATFYNTNKDWIDRLVRPINGRMKSVGKHAAGMLISPEPLINFIPLRTIASGGKKDEREIVSQWKDKHSEIAGILKLDILGLATLDHIELILKLVKERHNDIIDLNTIREDDPEVYRLFRKKDVTGIFQFNSKGMAELLSNMKADNIEDLISANALYRPGPISINAHLEYCYRKNGKKKNELGDNKPYHKGVHWNYDHHLEEKIMEVTYGLPVYQEQIMQAMHLIGGLTMAEADEIRTVMKKKDPKLMQKFKTRFIEGAKSKNNISEELALKMWHNYEGFSGYGFNRCITEDTKIKTLNSDISIKELKKNKIQKIAFNDHNPEFNSKFKQNLKLNKLNPKNISLHQEDASLFLLHQEGFDYIDLDPFGSPNPFLPAALARISRDGILAVTATDTAALTGTYAKVTRRKYWAVSLRNYLMHEIGLRILIRKIQLQGVQFDKALIPILSYHKDHYFRAYFSVQKGKELCDQIIEQHLYFLYCPACLKFKVSKFNSEKCDCGKIFIFAGPLWSGQLFDSKLVTQMAKNNPFPEEQSFLDLLAQEQNQVGFYCMQELSRKFNLNSVKLETILSKLKASRTHFSPTGFKCASIEELINHL